MSIVNGSGIADRVPQAPLTLGRLVDELPAGELVDAPPSPGPVITGIAQDSRMVEPGDLFVCITGGTSDGHDHAEEAMARGAAAVVVERSVGATAELTVRSSRRCVGPLAAAVYRQPSRAMRVIGITGTNGKTTTAHLVAAALSEDDSAVEVIGTLSGARTTPEAVDLQRTLAASRDRGVRTVVMEVSSHALELHRVDGVRFAAVVFTNLGHDHLDLHGSVDAYFAAKARLFTAGFSDLAVINADDPYGRVLLESVGPSAVGYSLADVEVLEVSVTGHRLRWRDLELEVPLGGAFNVANTVAALTVAEHLGCAPEAAARGVGRVGTVAGRFEVVVPPGPQTPTVVVDYAHTPEGLGLLLAAARPTGDGRVIAVFGCGGDRDREKRPLMGSVAAAGADLVLLTSDNPRHESPAAITDAIMSGVPAADRNRFTIEHDRRAAIGMALRTATAGDVVVVAGKGHETTQEIAGVHHPFDDRRVIRELEDQPMSETGSAAGRRRSDRRVDEP